MTALYKRSWLVRVGGLELKGVDCAWEIVRSIRKEPNSCSLRVYNLTKEQRERLTSLTVKPPPREYTAAEKQEAELAAIWRKVAADEIKLGLKEEAAKSTKIAEEHESRLKSREQFARNIRVEIEAGYETVGRSLRFRGDLRTCVHERISSDWQTTVEGEDGGAAFMTSVVSQSFPPGSTYASVITACARALGVGVGNLPAVTKSSRVFEDGVTLHGNASEQLARLVRALGVTYSVQNGVLQFQRPTTAAEAAAAAAERAFTQIAASERAQGLKAEAMKSEQLAEEARSRLATGLTVPGKTRAVLLSPDTGLIGDPAKDVSGIVKVTALLLPDLVPGALVSLQSRDLKGLYQVKKTTDTCETFGQPWYVQAEIKPA